MADTKVKSSAEKAYEAFLQNIEFRKDADRVRRRLGYPTGGYKERVDLDHDYFLSHNREAYVAAGKDWDGDKILARMPSTLLENATAKLVAKHRCSPFWDSFITDFITYGDRSKLRPTTNVGVRSSDHMGKPLDYLIVHVDANINSREWKAAWKDVSWHLASLKHKRVHQIRALDDERLEDGRRAAELKQEDPNLTNREIAARIEEELGGIYDYTQIPGLIRTFERQSKRK